MSSGTKKAARSPTALLKPLSHPGTTNRKKEIEKAHMPHPYFLETESSSEKVANPRSPDAAGYHSLHCQITV
jgi:hypothetical protein